MSFLEIRRRFYGFETWPCSVRSYLATSESDAMRYDVMLVGYKCRGGMKFDGWRTRRSNFAMFLFSRNPSMLRVSSV